MKQFFLSFVVVAMAVVPLAGQTSGGITPELLKQLKTQGEIDPANRALNNAVAANSIKTLVVNQENQANFDTYFSNRVPSKGITNQEASGRCWLFTGLNVLRSEMMARHHLGEFFFSQNYNFFYDQLEKSNLFLQAILDHASQPKDDKLVEWLFKNPLSDGGTFTGVSDLVMKYGLVPSTVMPETYSSNNTAQMSSLLIQKLREYGLTLRKQAAKGAKREALKTQKAEMLSTIYRMLVRCLGEPPTEFTWTRTDANGKPIDTRKYTPQSFYKEYVNKDLNANFVMLMNDPSRDFYQCYEIDLDRHTYDGHNWRYVNLPIEDIQKMAIASIKDSTMMYFSCDVGKCLDSRRGLLDVHHFDYGALLGTDFPMNKSERVQSFASGSSHAMTLMAVDLTDKGQPKKWMVENSWGASNGYQGHLMMTDEWFHEYMFRLVVDKKYVPATVLQLLKQKPILLPPWDPMFAAEE